MNGAGWTPNGIQILELRDGNIIEHFEFNPNLSLDELWGPVDVRWLDKSSLIMQCLLHNADGGYLTVFKKLQFEKVTP